MRQETIIKTYYKFKELSEEAQEKAIEKLWDLNVDPEWWESTYDDAKTIGLKITGFDINHGNKIHGNFTISATECAELIMKNHGESCDTYILAREFIADCDRKEENTDEREELEVEFERAIKEEYLSILRKEYEYLTSREAIIECINSNDYEFNEEGRLERWK